MLLGKDGSEGLDLSFVTHIFFLEQVWDKSLEQQAIARAWRMGAKGAVDVETLIAENSVEDTLSRLERSFDGDTNSYGSIDDFRGIQAPSDGGKSSEYQRAKLQYLLKSLRLVTSSATLSFGAKKRDSFPSRQVTSELPARKKARKGRVQFRLP